MFTSKTLLAALALTFIAGSASAMYASTNSDVVSGSYEISYDDKKKSDKDKKTKQTKEKYGY